MESQGLNTNILLEENSLKNLNYKIKKIKILSESKKIKRIQKRNNKFLNIKIFKKKCIINFLFIFISLIIIIFLIIAINKRRYIDIEYQLPEIIIKDSDQEYKHSQEYWNMIQNQTLYSKNKIFYPTKNPKISIVVPVHNGEFCIKRAIISIQNQDFKDIEIIVIDDYSTDESVKITKELIKTEPRIKFYQNEVNKGAFYTKTRGILLAKGKYILTLDDDDIFLQSDAFTSLYLEAEKNNLDLLKFTAILGNMISERERYEHNNEATPIIYQPEINKLMFYKGYNGKIERNPANLWGHMFRTDLLVKVIKSIDEKYFKRKINHHDDFILFFLFLRNAKISKEIKRNFYVYGPINSFDDPKVAYRNKEKEKNIFNLQCNAYIDFDEIVFDKTENNKDDKKIAFFQLEEWFLDHKCRNNLEVKERALNLCNKFLDSPYIEEQDKNKIRNFIN